MIPVLITALVNRPDLLDRMFDSLDVEVGRALVVDNGRTDYRREGVVTFAPPFHGLGWPGAINFGVMQTPDAPWWLFVNNDAYFEPGVLARLVERMDQAGDDYGLITTQGFTVGALNRACVDIVGLFDDQTFYPLYFDDNDYTYRCRLAGVRLERDAWCLEGEDGHTTSATTRSDEALAHANNRTWQLNRQGYVAKWGGPPGREVYTSPWGIPGIPVWATKPDPAGRFARLW